MVSLTFLDSGIWVWITWWWLDGTCKRASRLPYRPLPVLPCRSFPAVLPTAFSSSRVCANACGERSVASQTSIATAWEKNLSTKISVQFKCHFPVVDRNRTVGPNSCRWKPPWTFSQCLLVLRLLLCHSASCVWSWRHGWPNAFSKGNQSVYSSSNSNIFIYSTCILYTY